MNKLENKNKIKEEYEKAIDYRLLDFINSQIIEYKPKQIFEIGKPSNRHIKDVKKVLNIEITNFKIVIDAQHLKHIINRHGINGKADHSMADIKDIARIKYILDNYDEMKILKDKNERIIKSNSYQNSDGTRPIELVIFKKINGYYILSEVIVDAKKKYIFISTAYKVYKLIK